jgi:hypothetical protein
MAERKELSCALRKLDDPTSQFEIVSGGGGSAWILQVAGVDIAPLTEEKRNWILAPKQDLDGLGTRLTDEIDARVRENVKLAVRSLLCTPSVPENLDSSTAEIIMGWSRVGEPAACGCLTYEAANGDTHHIARDSAVGCTAHETWSPSTKLKATQDLFEKPFLCLDGRYLCIENLNTDLHSKAPVSGGPIEITAENTVACRANVTFRNTARSEKFTVSYDGFIPPAAVCIAALSQIGINVQIKT